MKVFVYNGKGILKLSKGITEFSNLISTPTYMLSTVNKGSLCINSQSNLPLVWAFVPPKYRSRL